MILLPIAILGMENASDRAFMAQLYMDYRTYMYNVSKKILFDEREVEDAINDASESLIKKIDLLKTMDSCTLRAYVVSTIRNTSLNRLKSKKRLGKRAYLAGDEVFLGIAALGEDVDAGVIGAQRIDVIKQMLVRLPERDRDVLTMKYLNDLKDAEIAQALGIKPGSVRAYLTAARRHAQELMKEMLKGEGWREL